MFERFVAAYGPGTAHPAGGGWFPDGEAPRAVGLVDLMDRYAGYTFRDGLYRLHTATSARQADEWVRDMWPGRFAGRVACFGSDWRGRQFSLDAERLDGDEPLVMLYEPGTGDALEIPATFASFHDEILIDRADAAVETSAFAEWVAANPASVPLAFDTCVGYRVPLFLGGEDELDNLELSDMDVYWSIVGGLASGIRHAT